jgi:hypothetical protein
MRVPHFCCPDPAFGCELEAPAPVPLTASQGDRLRQMAGEDAITTIGRGLDLAVKLGGAYPEVAETVAAARQALRVLGGEETAAEPAAASRETLEALPVAGRVEQDTATAGTLITPALLAEIGRRLYEYENAIDWHTLCTSCAAVMGSAYAETMRAEKAEAERDEAQAKLAGVRSVLLEGGQDDATARRRALAITGTGQAHEASDEKGAGHG